METLPPTFLAFSFIVNLEFRHYCSIRNKSFSPLCNWLFCWLLSVCFFLVLAPDCESHRCAVCWRRTIVWDWLICRVRFLLWCVSYADNSSTINIPQDHDSLRILCMHIDHLTIQLFWHLVNAGNKQK